MKARKAAAAPRPALRLRLTGFRRAGDGPIAVQGKPACMRRRAGGLKRVNEFVFVLSPLNVRDAADPSQLNTFTVR